VLPGDLRAAAALTSGFICDTGPVPEPVIPMSTTDALPLGLPQDRAVNRAMILTSRGHPNPGSARDALAEWAQRSNFEAVVGVRFVAVPEVISEEDPTTVVKWAAYGTAIGW
jgi:hypothetical protein